MKTLLKNIVTAIITLEAKMLLKRMRPMIIGITGSVGKTSVKDAIYSVLKNRMYARKSEKSYNSDIGVALTVLGLENAWSNPFRWLKNIVDGFFLAIHPHDYPRLLILEMGVDRPGDMERLTSWIKPDVVVVTRLPDVPVHVEYFSSPEQVAEEKLKLVKALKPDGVFVYNQDDPKIQEAVNETLQRSIGYSRYSLSPYTASADRIVYENGIAVGVEFTLTHLNTAKIMRVQGSLGAQHTYTYAAAAAVASVFDIGLDEVTDALRAHVPPPGRMRLLPGIKNTLIIDDTYNASPVASEQALQTLKELRGVQRRVAVLGDMMELGQFSIREHERIGRVAAGAVDLLVTVGVRARGYAKGALEGGLSEKNILQYDDTESARRELESIVRQGDAILIKGSQSIRAERLVEEIMAEPERKEELLVRQTGMWQEI